MPSLFYDTAFPSTTRCHCIYCVSAPVIHSLTLSRTRRVKYFSVSSRLRFHLKACIGTKAVPCRSCLEQPRLRAVQVPALLPLACLCAYFLSSSRSGGQRGLKWRVQRKSQVWSCQFCNREQFGLGKSEVQSNYRHRRLHVRPTFKRRRSVSYR